MCSCGSNVMLFKAAQGSVFVYVKMQTSYQLQLQIKAVAEWSIPFQLIESLKIHTNGLIEL